MRQRTRANHSVSTSIKPTEAFSHYSLFPGNKAGPIHPTIAYPGNFPAGGNFPGSYNFPGNCHSFPGPGLGAQSPEICYNQERKQSSERSVNTFLFPGKRTGERTEKQITDKLVVCIDRAIIPQGS